MNIQSDKYIGKFWGIVDGVSCMVDCDKSAFVLHKRLVEALSGLSYQEIMVWERVLEEHLNAAMDNYFSET